jgi:hypothetical protein
MKLSLTTTLALLVLAPSANAFAGMSSTSNADVSRRESFANVAAIVGGIAGLALPKVASAMPDEETPRVIARMGGLLVSTKDPRPSYIISYYYIIYSIHRIVLYYINKRHLPHTNAKCFVNS